MASRHPPRVVEWADRFAPDLEVFEAIASQTLAQLPREIIAQCGHLQITLAEFADEAILDAMGIEDAFELMGLFEGNGLTQGAAELLTGQMPNRIWLFRRPILDYWAAGTESLGNVIAHVLIHEIGHHFGLSDEDMDAIEAAAED
ncbi:metallopeptidase family protein [Roseibium suaedae]|uniref:Predicted Zn-dependent protease, minimal metalloprotease (MMP)-like domain n=1 Tax=Roseibium suaedae TaxID=735517 RepID=A0A1M7N0C4_9HYPH|nr:metallopeptidase family protein [Roseibium suaedae]SHM96825.1 Predicted Zn-dependent protease, minimal metalloprotease (MMP)-like domain [Roseibium suaedae]